MSAVEKLARRERMLAKLDERDVGWVGLGKGYAAHYSQVPGRTVCGKLFTPGSEWGPDVVHGYVCGPCGHGYWIRHRSPGKYPRPEPQTCTPTVTPADIAAGARWAALDEAEQVCRKLAEDLEFRAVATECANAIAQLKGGAK